MCVCVCMCIIPLNIVFTLAMFIFSSLHESKYSFAFFIYPVNFKSVVLNFSDIIIFSFKLCHIYYKNSNEILLLNTIYMFVYYSTFKYILYIRVLL